MYIMKIYLPVFADVSDEPFFYLSICLRDSGINLLV